MSYHKIFSVVNEHTAATVTGRYAISLAAACKAELVLYAVHDEGNNEAQRLHTNRHMEHLFSVASALGITANQITEVGNFNKLFPARVKTENADLVWYPLTPHDRYGVNQKQHAAHPLFRAIRPDLAIMRAVSMAKPHPGHILAPLDKSVDDRGQRLQFITALAKSFQAEVTLLHVSAQHEAQRMPEGVARFREQLQQQDIMALERSGAGNIGKAIVVEAITRHNDLIVLGASRRGVLRSLFAGNPAGDIMQHPPCNAILFRGAL